MTRLEAQRRFVAELERAAEVHPFPDYLARLAAERTRLEQMEAQDGAWILHWTSGIALAAVLIGWLIWALTHAAD